MVIMSALWSRKFLNFELLSSVYITLIPKMDGAELVTDFRPISLIQSVAMMITMILANCLDVRIHGMVTPNQSAFIKGCSIQDNFMLVQQTAKFLYQHRQSSLLHKLDILKAFNSVSWTFLLEVLHHLGFGKIWRDVISGLFVTSSTRVLLNGVVGQLISHR
jgi:hypothetical protein